MLSPFLGTPPVLSCSLSTAVVCWHFSSFRKELYERRVKLPRSTPFRTFLRTLWRFPPSLYLTAPELDPCQYWSTSEACAPILWLSMGIYTCRSRFEGRNLPGS